MWRLLGTGLIITSVWALAAPASAAPDITGTLTNARSGTSVLLVGNNGSSVSAKVTAKGRFTLKPGRLTSQIMPKSGAGPTLHLVRDGRYLGPVLLDTKTRRTGYLRLAGGTRKPVSLGRLAIRRPGYGTLLAAPKRSLLDTRRTVRLVAGVPLGAGNQGLTRSAGASAAAGWVNATGEAGLASLGSDADQDGVPNTADVDMNGDGVLDAAQAESALPLVGGGALSGDEVLSGRPQTATQFAKILNAPQNGVPINTNRNPGLTWAQLSDYLRDNLQIEVLLGRGSVAELFCDGNPSGCSEAQRVAELWMGCGQLAYCLPGAAATIIAPPGTGLDRQPLSTLRADTGLISIPLDPHTSGGNAFERGFQLGFMPKATDESGLQFAGDTFEFTVLASDGTVMGRQVKVLTSSVATPPEWSSVGGSPAGSMPLVMNPQQARSLSLSFNRPQRLVSTKEPAPVLADRGGLQYDVYLMSGGPGPSSFYWCRSSQITSTHPDLVKVRKVGEMQGRDEPLYDANVSPSDGAELSFSLDVAGCLADPASGSGPAPQPGTIVTIEMESQDADGNRTRTRTQVIAP